MKNIKTIKNCVVFFTVITVISLVVTIFFVLKPAIKCDFD